VGSLDPSSAHSPVFVRTVGQIERERVNAVMGERSRATRKQAALLGVLSQVQAAVINSNLVWDSIQPVQQLFAFNSPHGQINGAVTDGELRSRRSPAAMPQDGGLGFS
jgi:hypothetical protein